MTRSHVDQLTQLALNLHATDRDLYQQGLKWYSNANNVARALAFVLDPHQTRPDWALKAASAVIAALSPQQSWAKNQEYAAIMVSHYAKGGTLATLEGVGQTGANIAKAWAVLNGGDPLDVLGGDKVRSFYANILSGGHDDAVTVDRHAVSAYYLPGDETFKSLTPKRYAMVAQAYRDAAAVLGVTPPQMQAICWVAWRGTAQ